MSFGHRMTLILSCSFHLSAFTSSFILTLLHIPFTLTAQPIALAQQYPQKSKDSYGDTACHPFFSGTYLVVLRHKDDIHYCCIHRKDCNCYIRVFNESHNIVFVVQGSFTVRIYIKLLAKWNLCNLLAAFIAYFKKLPYIYRRIYQLHIYGKVQKNSFKAQR